MREIKINVVDWWNDEFEKNYFISFLSRKYKIVQSDKPDYLICSLFGSKHLDYDCIKIFITGENFTPDFNLYDYAIGFDFIDFEDRYLRFPLWLMETSAIEKAYKKHLNITSDAIFRDFCSFVVSNGSNAHPIREIFFDKLSKSNFIASGGAFRNNIGGANIKDKHSFIKKYKFNLAFENTQNKGYCTEKLFQALAAQTVPIYWGWGKEEFVNPKSFIDIDNFSSIEEAIGFIEEINEDSEKYLQILKEPAFTVPNIQEIHRNRLEKFFDHIFEQPLKDCKRVHRLGTKEGYYWKTVEQNTIYEYREIVHKIEKIKKTYYYKIYSKLRNVYKKIRQKIRGGGANPSQS